MLEEIEEFLRRAAEKRGEILRPPEQQQRPVQAEYVEPQVAEVEIVEPEVIDQAPYSRQPSYDLPDSQLEYSDERLESRLHETFDHRLGSLDPDGAKMASDEADHPHTSPKGLAKMLSSPQGLRNAFVLSEILRRPEHRW